jgi:hypothetical protein
MAYEFHTTLIQYSSNSGAVPVTRERDGDIKIGDYDTGVSIHMKPEQAIELASALMRLVVVAPGADSFPDAPALVDDPSEAGK